MRISTAKSEFLLSAFWIADAQADLSLRWVRMSESMFPHIAAQIRIFIRQCSDRLYTITGVKSINCHKDT